MRNARKKFLIFAVAAVTILLVVILAVINAVNFTMAADDADRITGQLARNRGEFNQMDMERNGENPEYYKPGTMGPGSPDMNPSVRYFTVKIDSNGNATEIIHRINAFSETEAITLAKKLQNETTGWVDTTYRYRVYKNDGSVFVTVIDFSRELSPSYRILYISLIGGTLGLVISVIFLAVVGKKLFEPIEEADKKQKNFIRNAQVQFRIPLTIISANTEISEKNHGSDEFTKSTHRQVKKMTDLVKRLNEMTVFDDKNEYEKIDISEVLKQNLEKARPDFYEKNIEIKTEIEDNVIIKSDKEKIDFIIDELIRNGIKFSNSFFGVYLSQSENHIVLKTRNDTSLPDGELNMIFDRFTRLSNASEKEGYGLGLSYVKDIIGEQNGRTFAESSDGIITITVTL